MFLIEYVQEDVSLHAHVKRFRIAFPFENPLGMGILWNILEPRSGYHLQIAQVETVFIHSIGPFCLHG